jgi:hypothetical protein
VYREEPGGANDGVTRLLGQLKHQFDFLDAGMRFEKCALAILPDAVAVDDKLARRLRAYLDKGGKLLLTGRSGLDESLQPVLPEMGVQVEGESPYQTTYLRFGPAVAEGVPATDHVMYERGIRMRPARGAQALAEVIEPYFDRNYQHFCSHAQTPPAAAPDRTGAAAPSVSNSTNASPRPYALLRPYAAAIRKGNVVTIPYPIFQAYGTHANVAYRQLVGNCLKLLLPQPLALVQAPSTMEVTVMRQGKRTVVHLLQFVADRRTAVLDMIEDIIPLYDVPLSLRMDRAPKSAYLAPSGERLNFDYAGGRVNLTVPKVVGHQMVVFE